MGKTKKIIGIVGGLFLAGIIIVTVVAVLLIRAFVPTGDWEGSWTGTWDGQPVTTEIDEQSRKYGHMGISLAGEEPEWVPVRFDRSRMTPDGSGTGGELVLRETPDPVIEGFFELDIGDGARSGILRLEPDA